MRRLICRNAKGGNLKVNPWRLLPLPNAGSASADSWLNHDEVASRIDQPCRRDALLLDDGRGRPFERICDHIAERSPDSGLRIDVTFIRVTSTEKGLAWQLPFFSVHPG